MTELRNLTPRKISRSVVLVRRRDDGTIRGSMRLSGPSAERRSGCGGQAGGVGRAVGSLARLALKWRRCNRERGMT